MLTQARLKELLDYDPETGLFTRLVTTSSQAVAGSVVGSDNGTGYLRVMVDGRRYCLHKLVWLYVHGSFPHDMLDHINMDKSDNRLCNLREASMSENRCNVGVSAANTSGAKGVCWHARIGKWQVTVGIGKTKQHVGYFSEYDDAVKERDAAARQTHGLFFRSA